MDRLIDLHVHTRASDGSMRPEELVRYALQKNITAIAITDHDTIASVEEAVSYGKQYGVEVIPGIEISVEYDVQMHILGYFIDTSSPILKDMLSKFKKYRLERNPQIIEKLNKQGMDITIKEVEEKAKGEIIGRPHVALLMKEKGYVSSIDEAFEKYLDAGRPAYVARKKLLPQEGIALIKQIGGIAVLAHPIYLRKNYEELNLLLKKLKSYGLDGIEAYYSTYTCKDHYRYMELAKKHKLIVTGGSDFHGKNKSNIDLGTGYGTLKVPYSLLEDMKNLIEENPPIKL